MKEENTQIIKPQSRFILADACFLGSSTTEARPAVPASEGQPAQAERKAKETLAFGPVKDSKGLPKIINIKRGVDDKTVYREGQTYHVAIAMVCFKDNIYYSSLGSQLI